MQQQGDYMEKNNTTLAEEYYKLVNEKNAEGIKKYLHPEVELHSPLGNVKGKESYLAALKHFMNTINSLVIRKKFGSNDQAMLIIDVDIPGISRTYPTAALLSFKDGLIIKNELFVDTKPFIMK